LPGSRPPCASLQALKTSALLLVFSNSR
jgi:hypothetical protein